LKLRKDNRLKLGVLVPKTIGNFSQTTYFHVNGPDRFWRYKGRLKNQR